MRQDTIYITRTDKSRLTDLIHKTLRDGGPDIAHLRALGDELERAKVVESAEVPADVITMNSTVRISDLETGEFFTYTLAYPDHANVDEGRISILAAVGTGLLGYRVGNVVEWPVPAGIRKMRVEEVLYQPEAAGVLNG
jgi:regulator of nucleoside diphosphate kinase